MAYINGKEILPEDLLSEIQKHFVGGLIYIPYPENERCKWGSRTTIKTELQVRNQEICLKKEKGLSIQKLMDEYHLSYDTIKKIIYQH